MRNITYYFTALVFLLTFVGVNAQNSASKGKLTDANDALTHLTPEYKVPHEVMSPTKIKEVTDRVLLFLEANSPARLINKESKVVISDYSKIDQNAVIEPSSFRLTSYEWGVTYTGMLLTALVTGDERYKKYVSDRFVFLGEIAPYFEKLSREGGIDGQMEKVVHPKALDDAGAICASMIKAQMGGMIFNGKPMIDRYMNYIMNKNYRLADGTFARNVPFKNTVWLDDMYMSIPAIVNMGKMTGDKKYYDEAIKQVTQFAERMFVKEKGLYRHGWVEGMTEHPAFHWGRANGWAILAKLEVLDALPENYPGREKVLELFRAHVRGLAPLQSGDGFWHQLLDKNDSYVETSCTAIYTYCIAHAVNKGWIDPLAYGPIAVLGWNAVSTKVNSDGEVEGTCVGTGMEFNPQFYYYRPAHKYAAHGYGPVLLAGAEMIRLVQTMGAKN